MIQNLFRKVICGVEVEVNIDDTEYTPEEEKRLKAQFIYALTSELV